MNTNYFLILIVIGIISSGLIISNSQLSFAQLFGCSEPFVDIIVPKWLDEVKICFDDQDKIFELGQDVTIHMYAETNESAKRIRVHFFHQSQSGYFDKDGTERQEIIESRINQSPHIISLQDNERIFGTNLEDATHFTINCNDPPCKKPYEKERIFQFSFPGPYQYEITMQVNNTENIYSYYPGIEIFKVLNHDELLENKANEVILSEKLEPTNTEGKEVPKEDSKNIIKNPWVVGIGSSIIVAGIIGSVGWILKSKRKSSNVQLSRSSDEKIVSTTKSYDIEIPALTSQFIDNPFVNPRELTVSVGHPVMWQNNDDTAHSITSGRRKKISEDNDVEEGIPDGRFDIILNPGENFEFEYDKEGTYHYYCKIHKCSEATIVIK